MNVKWKKKLVHAKLHLIFNSTTKLMVLYYVKLKKNDMIIVKSHTKHKYTREIHEKIFEKKNVNKNMSENQLFWMILTIFST